MADVFQIADFLIQLVNQSEDDQITNLKLNKLLYYAQGLHLARTGEPLFADPVEAWKFGPVIPAIYHKYKVCGRNPIPSDETAVDRSVFTPAEFEVLLDVMREFGQYTGSVLVTMTHKPGTPWSEANTHGNTTISHDAMRQFFTANPVPTFSSRLSIPVVSELPREWYDPTEDDEWEAYL